MKVVNFYNSVYKSGGRYYTLGVKDSEDIIAWSEWLKKSFDAENILLFGISMGGATALISAGKREDLYSGIISDSAPSDFKRMIMRVMRHRIGVLTYIFMPVLYLYVWLLAGYKLSAASASTYVKQIKVPVLFIHGSVDGLVPLEMMYELLQNTNSRKEQLIVQDADHTGALRKNEELYKKTVYTFVHSLF